MPHFEKLSFRVNKKIFRAFDQEGQFAVVKHFIQGQSVSCALKANVMYPVKGKLGLKVWTVTDLANPCKEMIIVR